MPISHPSVAIATKGNNMQSNDKKLLAKIKGDQNIAKLCNSLDRLIARNKTSKQTNNNQS